MKLMTHIVAGYPTLGESEQIARTLLDSGSGFLEIQIPFSDPIADGPVIAAANQIALQNGTRPRDAFILLRKLHEYAPDKKLLIMTYFNILKQYGVEKFCRDAARSNCYGLIVPDAPIDEEAHTHYLASCKKYGLHAIQIISPITPETRLKKIAQAASGFVYCVARFGVTGAQKKLPQELGGYLQRVRKSIKVALAVGFGISKRAHIAALQNKADIAVIGSQIIREYQKSGLSGVAKIITG
ncbi:tryptophan synthase subunit alpha [Candidatus Peregrinibacteria bacterium CG11_big_fil_rev_8_21_14_0_20_46_8]|nr:MAG: tryptophan synthase subunit alpha [Candidatus Peregrinibacteria bacterium CG11_big_fil_rev_8_21_14_0_20_46_8]